MQSYVMETDNFLQPTVETVLLIRTMQRSAEGTVRPAKRIKTVHHPSRTAIHTFGIQSSPHDGLYTNNPRAGRGPLAALISEDVDMEISTHRAKHAPKTSVRPPIFSRCNRYEHKSDEEVIKKKPYLTQHATSHTEPLDIDLSVAPSDPVELALWVARWIETVNSHPTEFAPETSWTTQRHRHPRTPGISPSVKASADPDHRLPKNQIRGDEGQAQLYKQKWKRQGL